MPDFSIPTGDFAGFIFDCDGTLVDSMPVHFEAWQAVLQEFGVPGALGEDEFYALGGVPTPVIVEQLNARRGLRLDPSRVTQRKEELYGELLPHVRPIEPVARYARMVAVRHPVAVASGGVRRVVERSLALAGLAGLFPVIVTAEDVARGKPAPDLFLLAAQRMGVEPRRCLVFEDAALGHEAARAAGMTSVHIPSRRAA